MRPPELDPLPLRVDVINEWPHTVSVLLFFYFAIVFHLVTTLSIPPSLSLSLHHFLISPFLISILVLTFLALLFILLPPLPRLLPLISLLPPLHCTSYSF